MSIAIARPTIDAQLLLRHFAVPIVALVLGVGISRFAWMRPELLPVALLLLPVAVSFAPNRGTIFALMFGYFAVGSAGLPGVTARFYYDPSWFVQYVLPWTLPALLALPFLLVSPRARPLQRGALFALALVLLTVPPIGLFGWENPLFAAAILYPGAGVAGLVAGTLLAAAMASLRGIRSQTGKLSAVAAIALLLAASIATMYSPLAAGTRDYGPMVNWAVADTHLPNTTSPAAETARSAKVVKLVEEASALPWVTAIILPESAIQPYRPVDEIMLFQVSDTAAQRKRALVFGSVIPGPKGTWRDTVMGAGTLALPSGAPRILTESRVPMPVGNWHLGFPGGASLHPFTTDKGTINGIPIAWSICYEDTILWPHPALLTRQTKALVALNNDWALNGTWAIHIQTMSASLLAKLAGVPLLSATNT